MRQQVQILITVVSNCHQNVIASEKRQVVWFILGAGNTLNPCITHVIFEWFRGYVYVYVYLLIDIF